MNNCPFYGRALYAQTALPLKFLLLDSQGNQCAIVTDRHAPCRQEIDHLPVDWRECPLVRDIRMEEVD